VNLKVSTGKSHLPRLKFGTLLGQGQNHLAVAGGCRAAFWIPARLRRTHPLPRGGSDPVQV